MCQLVINTVILAFGVTMTVIAGGCDLSIAGLWLPQASSRSADGNDEYVVAIHKL
jgi:predicted ABC-type sugar transport system permease subunit